MNRHYYKQNYNKVSFAELKFHSPNIFAFPGLCAMKLFGLLPTVPTFSPMPTSFAFVDFERLSVRCREFISPAIESFRRLGFEILGFEILDGCEDPNYIDGGSCHLFHPIRNINAVASHVNFFELHGMPSEFAALTVWRLFENGHSLRLVNHGLVSYFHDKVLNRKTFRSEAASPFQMLPVFEKLLEKFGENAAPASIRTLRDLRSLFEKESRKVLEVGLESGRFVPMSELEVINMKQARIDKLSALREQFQGSTVRI